MVNVPFGFGYINTKAGKLHITYRWRYAGECRPRRVAKGRTGTGGRRGATWVGSAY